MCLLEPVSSPTYAHDAAANAAATAAASVVDQAMREQGFSVDPATFDPTVERAVAAAVRAVQTQPSTSTASPGTGWQLPGWVVFLGGSIVATMQRPVHRAA